jgi:hypothetical protein
MYDEKDPPNQYCAVPGNGGSIREHKGRSTHRAAPRKRRVRIALDVQATSIAAAQADVSDAANLYPGGHAARCIPAPIFGCVCTIDLSGEAVMFTDLDSITDHHFKDVANSEYSRMISWLRRTCETAHHP